MSIGAALLPEFDHECASSRKFLERLPEEKYGFKPHEKSMAAGRLASHIAELGMWGSMTLASPMFDMAPGGVPPFPAFNAPTKAELLAAFDKNVADARAAIAAASDADFMASWTLQKNGHVIFTLPKVAVIRSFVINHMVHHRAQLGVYLRLLDVPVPSVYGPSGDEN